MSTILNEVFRLGKARKVQISKTCENDQQELDGIYDQMLPQERPPLQVIRRLAYGLEGKAQEDLAIPLTPIPPIFPVAPFDGEIWTKEVMLIHAYLLEPSPLHPRRTLDQFYYPTSNTSSRDQDQVVYRYYRKHSLSEPKILMIDQLWLWILDTGLIAAPYFDFFQFNFSQTLSSLVSPPNTQTTLGPSHLI